MGVRCLQTKVHVERTGSTPRVSEAWTKVHVERISAVFLMQCSSCNVPPSIMWEVTKGRWRAAPASQPHKQSSYRNAEKWNQVTEWWELGCAFAPYGAGRGKWHLWCSRSPISQRMMDWRNGGGGGELRSGFRIECTKYYWHCQQRF